MRVTDALDVRFNPNHFRKTREGICVLTDNDVYILATGRENIKLGVRRGATTLRLSDVEGMLYRPRGDLVRGDVLNMYMDPDVDAHELYKKVVTIAS